MDRKTNVMDIQVVKTGGKTNIVDVGLDVFFHPFYGKQQACEILQQLKTELVNDSPQVSLFNPSGMGSSCSGHQVSNEDDEHLTTGSKKSVGDSGSWSTIVSKIQADIEKELGINLNLCLADWHTDGQGMTIDNEEDINTGSSIVMMSFGASRDLLFRWNNSERSKILSNLLRPNFSIYKLNLPSGSLLQMKPPINSVWSCEVTASENTEKSLHVLLRFMMNVEEDSNDDSTNFFVETSGSSGSAKLSLCSTISPETAKAIERRLEQWE